MRFAIILASAALLAAPAVAQRVVPAPDAPPADQAPPPEGFYKDIPNMYDLLARAQSLGNFTMINGRRMMIDGRPICPAIPADLTDEQRRTRLSCQTEQYVDSLNPPTQRKE